MVETRDGIEVISEKQAEILRRMTPLERLTRGFALWDDAKARLTRYLTSQNPEWSAVEVKKAVIERMSHGATRAHSANR